MVQTKTARQNLDKHTNKQKMMKMTYVFLQVKSSDQNTAASKELTYSQLGS